MDWSSLPAPSSYTDWQSWAAMLVQYLQSQGADSPVNIQSFVEDSSKDRNGLPVAADGDLIRVKDAEGNTSLKYWDKASESWVATTSKADLSGKADIDLSNVDENIDYVIESWKDGSNWYRIYKSGWIEQGGLFDNGSTTDKGDMNMSITLHKKYADNQYDVQALPYQSHSSYPEWRISHQNIDTFNLVMRYCRYIRWSTRGQGASDA